MERLRQRVPLWSPSANTAGARVDRATAGAVRILDAEDTPALRRLLDAAPVANAAVASQVGYRGTAAAGRSRNSALILGIDAEDDDHTGRPVRPSPSQPRSRLAAACWVGSNINPINASPAEAELFGLAVASLRRRTASIYGSAEAVLELYDATGWQNHREIRPHQPLMSIDRAPELEPLTGLRKAQPEDFGALEPACAAMFTEELGFSPYTQGVSQYRQRIQDLIANGHSLVATDSETGEVVFKAEFGAVTPHCVQVQGVWVRPEDRGRGLAAPGMAGVVRYGLELAPVVSLYVNDYNTRAVRSYQRVGFDTVGTFATVLF